MIHLQVVDTAKAAVIKDQDIDFLSFLHDGHNFTVQHLKTGIADYAVNLMFRLCKFNAQSCCHFISHTGISILCMISAPLIGGAHTLHTAWKGTSCRNDCGICINHSSDCCQCCGLGNLTIGQTDKFRNRSGISCFDNGLEIISGILNAAQPDHLFIPLFLCVCDLIPVLGYILFFSQLFCQCLYGYFCISHCHGCIHLIGMESAVIYGNKFHIFSFKQPLGAGSKIAQSGSNGDYHICILCNDIGGTSTGHSDSSKAVRMAGFAGTLSSLALSKGDLKFFTEFFYNFSCIRVANSSAHNHDGFLRFCNNVSNLFQFFFHCHRSCNLMNPFLKEILRIIIGFSLYILTEGNTAGSRLCRICEHTHGIN